MIDRVAYCWLIKQVFGNDLDIVAQAVIRFEVS